MLSYIWVSGRSAICGAIRFWVSGIVARSCGGLSREVTATINLSGSFITALFAVSAERGRANFYRANAEESGQEHSR